MACEWLLGSYSTETGMSPTNYIYIPLTPNPIPDPSHPNPP